MRRLLMVMMVVLHLSTGAFAETLYCVTTDQVVALVDSMGTERIRPGVCEDIFCIIEGSRYAMGIQTEAGLRYALCDAAGRALTEPLYEMLYHVDNVIIFRENGSYGAMTFDGNIILSGGYTQLVPNGEDGYLALISDPFDSDSDMIYLVVPGEETVSTGVRTASGLQFFSDGRMPFRSPTVAKYGYIDGRGTVCIEPQLDYAGSYSGGFARASEDGLFGVLNLDGSWQLEPECSFLAFGEGIIVALYGQEICRVYAMDDCALLFSVEGTGLQVSNLGEYTLVMEENKVRVYNREGTQMLEIDEKAGLSQGVGAQLILSDGEWGTACESVIDSDGTRSERREQHLLPLGPERYAFLVVNVAAYYSDLLDGIRYSCNYDSMRYGIMSASGETILPAEYQEIHAVGENAYLTVSEEAVCIVDADGKDIWRYALEVSEDM